MKVAIINKSDSTGGAAVVSRRLMEALRNEGVDAGMLVVEKISDSPYVELAASPRKIKRLFLWERLKVFIANGFNRATLFKIDTGEVGLPLWRHPQVKEADAVLLNWVNQGMLSLEGVGKIMALGKPVIWTMHDMWCMTGICHHAGLCNHYHNRCGDCPLLAKKSSPRDLSFTIHARKKALYDRAGKLAFVAVSSWLKEKARESSLLNTRRVEVIPNAFDVKPFPGSRRVEEGKIRILFGAARLDDPIKGLDTLRETSRILAEGNPGFIGKMEIVMFGGVKNPEALEGFALPVVNLGVLKGEEAVAQAYRGADILVSASSYETLPGTLVEAQAYGCIPVSFNQGGQTDIVTNGVTGFIAQYSQDPIERARNLAREILRAAKVIETPEQHREMLAAMRKNVEEKFSYKKIAQAYLNLIHKLLSPQQQ